LYNETDGRAIDPTPVVGVVGLLEHADRVLAGRFQSSGQIVVLLERGGENLAAPST
jgi:phosphoribosylformylglycinamidine synthase